MAEFRDIPGMLELWEQTRGDPRIRIAVLDGPVVLEHPCFEGARLTRPDVPWGPQEPGEHYEDFVMHATQIISQIVGQWGTEVEGIAPDVTVLNLVVGWGLETAASPLVLSQAFDMALDLGVDLIHCAPCHPTVSGSPEPMLADSVAKACQQDLLIVAPVGNDEGQSGCVPACLPGVLAVGGLSDEGRPRPTSNYGAKYFAEGLMAPGENILGAAADGGTQRQKGTSTAAPIVTAVAALLGSLQLREQGRVDWPAVRSALLSTALPCPGEEQERCLSGVLNIEGACRQLFGRWPVTPMAVPEPALNASAADPGSHAKPALTQVDPAASRIPARPRLAYVLGRLGYDFGTELVRDRFLADGLSEPENPAHLAAWLKTRPDEARLLIWTVTQEDCPLYALQPSGAFGDQTFAVLVAMLEGSYSRVSLPGVIWAQTRTLLGGETLPVLHLPAPRGMYGWSTAQLAEVSLATLPEAERERTRPALEDFLERVYHHHANTGLRAPDRALNFVATNAFQAVQALSGALAQGYTALDEIRLAKSPYGRVDGDCWDVLLHFLDPERDHRARRVYRLTVDVADMLPVTLGKLQSWSLPRNSGTRREEFALQH